MKNEYDRSRFIVVEHTDGSEIPSWLLSDGTLPMLALTIMAYLPTSHVLRTVLIEEPEIGLHPKAIEPIMQSLQSLYSSQVFVTTQSPIVLGFVGLNQVLCFSRDCTGEVNIVLAADHPGLGDWSEWKGEVSLVDLLSMGIL